MADIELSYPGMCFFVQFPISGCVFEPEVVELSLLHRLQAIESTLEEYDKESFCATQVMSSAILAHSNLTSGIGSTSRPHIRRRGQFLGRYTNPQQRYVRILSSTYTCYNNNFKLLCDGI